MAQEGDAVGDTVDEVSLTHKQEQSKRSHAEFGGMVGFKLEKKGEFRVSQNKHFADSMFCSGERQRIIKFLLENEHDGLDLARSKNETNDPDAVKVDNPLNDEAALAALARSDGEGDGEELIKDVFRKKILALGKLSEDDLGGMNLHQLRRKVRVWDCIEEYFPLHVQ